MIIAMPQMNKESAEKGPSWNEFTNDLLEYQKIKDGPKDCRKKIGALGDIREELLSDEPDPKTLQDFLIYDVPSRWNKDEISIEDKYAVAELYEYLALYDYDQRIKDFVAKYELSQDGKVKEELANLKKETQVPLSKFRHFNYADKDRPDEVYIPIVNRLEKLLVEHVDGLEDLLPPDPKKMKPVEEEERDFKIRQVVVNLEKNQELIGKLDEILSTIQESFPTLDYHFITDYLTHFDVPKSKFSRVFLKRLINRLKTGMMEPPRG